MDFQRDRNLITPSTYESRLKMVVSGGIILFYGLYEGCTRDLTKKLVAYDLGIPENEIANYKFYAIIDLMKRKTHLNWSEKQPIYDNIFDIQRFHDIRNLLKRRYKITMDKKMYELSKAHQEIRNEIIHGKFFAAPDFHILEKIYSHLMTFFHSVEQELPHKLPDIFTR